MTSTLRSVSAPAMALAFIGLACASGPAGSRPGGGATDGGSVDHPVLGEAGQDRGADSAGEGGRPDGGCSSTEDVGPVFQIDGRFSSNDDAQVLASTHYVIPTERARPYAIFAGPDGNMWFVEGDSNKIGRITPCGSITEFAVSPPISRIGIAVFGSDGDLWLSDQARDDLYRMTPAGTLTKLPIQESISVATIAGDGNLWFSDRYKIKFIGASGTVTEITDLPPPAGGITDLTKGPDGNLWFAIRVPAAIGRVTPSGTWSVLPLPSPQDSLYHIVTGPDGNLWYTKRWVVGRMTPAGVATEFSLDTLPGEIVVGPDNNLWTVDVRNLLRLTLDGAITRFVITPSPMAGSFYATSVGGLAAGADGNLWATDYSTDGVIRLSVK